MLHTQQPFTFILFGASGHLAQLKMYPALYTLALKKRMPDAYAVVGYARTEMDDGTFRALVEASIRRDMPEVTEKALAEFLTHVHYHRGEYGNTDDYHALEKMLARLESGEPWTRLAYLSIPPTIFADVLRGLCASGVHRPPFRCIVEKPVGHDLASAEKIREQLGCFQKDEIFFLDHYLGKEAVRNVYFLRYANPVLERLFKNTLIRHVEITALEVGGIEGRVGYFEHVGTFRDMVQSHLLMIASLLTMRLREDEHAVGESRLDALQQFYLPPATDLNETILQGQYASAGSVAGYRDEKDVDPQSRTNTFIALKLLTRTPRWQGVPFSFRTGKRLSKKETRISIQFQVPHSVGSGSTPNRLDIILQGEAGMRLFLQTKLGGSQPMFRPLIMSDPLVCMGDCLPEHGLLLLEAINGKSTWFPTFEEVRAAWRLVDPLQAHLQRAETPFHLYPAGSDGPQEMDAWIAKDGVIWLN